MCYVQYTRYYMNDIIRDIKLAKTLGTEPSENAKKVINFFDELFNDMRVHVDYEFGRITCWKDNYKYYFIQKNSNYSLKCGTEVWKFFTQELYMNFSDTRTTIEYMLSDRLKIKVNKLRFLIKRSQ